jgi:hypothetical protein
VGREPAAAYLNDADFPARERPRQSESEPLPLLRAAIDEYLADVVAPLRANEGEDSAQARGSRGIARGPGPRRDMSIPDCLREALGQLLEYAYWPGDQ